MKRPNAKCIDSRLNAVAGEVSTSRFPVASSDIVFSCLCGRCLGASGRCQAQELSRERNLLQLFIDLFSRVIVQREVASQPRPCAHSFFSGFRGRFDDHVLWQACFDGKPFKKGLIQFSCVFFFSDGQAHFAVFDVGDRRNEVVARREMRCPSIRVGDRPVFQMHVCVADRCVKSNAADKFRHGVCSEKIGDVACHVGVAVVFVFVVRKLVVDLIEVFNMNLSTFRCAVEPSYIQRIAFFFCKFFGQPLDLIGGNESGFSDIDADGGGKFHHRVFIFGNKGESRRWELDDPSSATALCGNGELLAGAADRGELQLYSSEREAEDAFLSSL